MNLPSSRAASRHQSLGEVGECDSLGTLAAAKRVNYFHLPHFFLLPQWHNNSQALINVFPKTCIKPSLITNVMLRKPMLASQAFEIGSSHAGEHENFLRAGQSQTTEKQQEHFPWCLCRLWR